MFPFLFFVAFSETAFLYCVFRDQSYFQWGGNDPNPPPPQPLTWTRGDDQPRPSCTAVGRQRRRLRQHSSAGLEAPSGSLSTSSTMSKALITKTHTGYIPITPTKYHRRSYCFINKSSLFFFLRNQTSVRHFIVVFLGPRRVIILRGRCPIVRFVGMRKGVYNAAKLSIRATPAEKKKVEMLGNINISSNV